MSKAKGTLDSVRQKTLVAVGDEYIGRLQRPAFFVEHYLGSFRFAHCTLGYNICRRWRRGIIVDVLKIA